MANFTTILPDVLPLGVVAKVVSTLVAVLLAYSALTADLGVVKNDVDNLKARMQRIEDKLDRLLERP